ncbi:endonuclease/exonuclease/phosphatase family protein [Abyssalbus ytuae]|uniref:Endonuclease/exonuclease/phosphatase family protein n=1 Tax=Abyssalbus ytuae TaxID=2926907 RepID=A0A9E6ZK54_9FLAO|nr:endonuclease/exonuclease/phosphatase family protein [Abyssalbus ytuae]UOB17147.1 endonuclease/exonuclease/phosphatase family protein [Abyssalbus ytuae]
MKQKLIILAFFCLIVYSIKAQEITVLTYNVKFDDTRDTVNGWNNRKDFMVSQLSFYEPDIFGTQEGLINQLKFLKENLSNYNFIGVGRDKGNSEGEHTAIFYKTDKLKVLEHSTFWLSETPQKPSKGWDAALNRICSYALFKHNGSKQSFWVFNTHFDHMGKQARKESVKLILKKIEELNHKKLPVILMGDFNLEPNNESIVKLSQVMNDVHLTKGINIFGPAGTFNGFNFHEPVTRRIDYIFLSKTDFKVVKYAVLSDSKNCKYPSDHLPVLAKVNFKRE